jgi:MarR family transcriptional regulator, organic hydroperoxide resistance regulator
MENRNGQVQAVTRHLRLILRAMQAHSKLVEKTCGLSSAKLSMLYEIAASPGLKVSTLAASLFIHPSTCSNMLGRLEEENLVVRDRQKADQRSVHLYLTEEGVSLLAMAPRPFHGRLSSALQQLNAEELAMLDGGLAKITAALAVYRGEDVPHPPSATPGE